jgi:hypothetical protein
VSGALDSRRLAEYRRKIRDPRYLAHALVHVASVLVDMLALADRPGSRGGGREGDPWRLDDRAS